MAGAKGPNEFVSEAYSLESEADKVAFYRKWAQEYDHQMLDELGFVAPTLIAQQLADKLPDRDSAVFDIGCGTGLTCVYLAGQGYTRLDGIDLSPDMVRVAAERGIYRELLVGDVTRPLDRDDASYAGVISSGTFTHGHVGPEPLDEIFRILKPGGWLACTVHRDIWETMGFKNRFDGLEQERVARRVDLRLDKYYASGEPEGWYCLYQKTA